MSSRDKILAALQKNQPALVELPVLDFVGNTSIDLKEQFIKTLTGIGGSVIEASDLKEVADRIKSTFPETGRIVNRVVDFEISSLKSDPHDLSNVIVAIMMGEFGVAENGAIWLTDANMGDQALPYICEHLVLIINKNSIVPTLHEAYEKIGSSTYNLGTFLAGPSKTADIEQSLVLGAHGSKSLIVFLINQYPC
ncbi:MAG: LUD domain-containing protein [Cyclobacteriaceae bacterium]